MLHCDCCITKLATYIPLAGWQVNVLQTSRVTDLDYLENQSTGWLQPTGVLQDLPAFEQSYQKYLNRYCETGIPVV